MGDRIVDARIKAIKEIKGKTDEHLLDDYGYFIKDRTGSWLFQQHKKEILERMANDRDYVP